MKPENMDDLKMKRPGIQHKDGIKIKIMKPEIIVSDHCYTPNSRSESEKPCQRVSNADRKVFANPESFCDMLIIG